VDDRDVTDVLHRLVGDLDDEAADWKDVLSRAAAPQQLLVPKRSRPRFLAAGAAVAAAAAVAVVIAGPWEGGPSILDRAAAAILTPSPNQILYERIAFRPSGIVHMGHLPTVPIEVWVDGAPGGAFRITTESPPPFPGVPGKTYRPSPLTPVETGGHVGSSDGLSYTLSNGTLFASPFFAPITKGKLDPAEYVKESLTSGRATVDGTTIIRGRRVVRIRILGRPEFKTETTALFFVDAHTYRPVRIELNASLPFSSRVGYPLTCFTYGMAYGCGPMPGAHAMWVYDFTDYRYLPRTAANLKLTRIRAMHPKAKIV
jgi:hypothetical protein